jgi:hypothetical protein
MKQQYKLTKFELWTSSAKSIMLLLGAQWLSLIIAQSKEKMNHVLYYDKSIFSSIKKTI